LMRRNNFLRENPISRQIVADSVVPTAWRPFGSHGEVQ
jgi:hypothetical protein